MNFQNWFESQFVVEWKYKKRQFGISKHKHGGDRHSPFNVKDARYVKPMGIVRRVFPDIQSNIKI